MKNYTDIGGDLTDTGRILYRQRGIEPTCMSFNSKLGSLLTIPTDYECHRTPRPTINTLIVVTLSPVRSSIAGRMACFDIGTGTAPSTLMPIMRRNVLPTFARSGHSQIPRYGYRCKGFFKAQFRPHSAVLIGTPYSAIDPKIWSAFSNSPKVPTRCSFEQTEDPGGTASQLAASLRLEKVMSLPSQGTTTFTPTSQRLRAIIQDWRGKTT